MTVSSDKEGGDKTFVLSEKGGPEPFCPGCLNPPNQTLGLHLCDSLSEDGEDGNIVIFTTALAVCPFCHENIDITSVQSIDENKDKVLEAMRAAHGDIGVPAPSFQLLAESSLIAKLWAWMRPRMRLMTILTIISFVLTIVFAPPVYNYYVDATERLPTLEKIRCDNQHVVAGQRVTLTAILKDAEGLNPAFDWKCTPCQPGQIEGNGPEVSLNTNGIDTHLGPVHLTVSLKLKGHSKESPPQDIFLEIISPESLNKPPVLKGIQCPSQEVKAGELVTLTAFTSDPDRDALTYDWQPSTTMARIEGSGQVVMLNTSDVHPQSGPVPVKVTLTVNDNHGGSVTNDITINVLPNQPTKTAKEMAAAPPAPLNNAPRIISFQPNPDVIHAGDSVKLTVLAEDPDNNQLFYKWETTAGRIEGQAPNVVLKTSETDFSLEPMPQNITVMLTVSDGRGGFTTQHVIIRVLPPLPPPAKTPTVEPGASPKVSPT